MTMLSSQPSTPAAGSTPAWHPIHLVVQAEAIPVPNQHYPLRLLVSGSRDYDNMNAVAAVLGGIALSHGTLHVTHGGAPGLDSIARDYAIDHRWSYETVEANWDAPCRAECHHGPRRYFRRGVPRRVREGLPLTYCPAQGNYRNQAMVDKGHDLCIGWFSRPQSTGTLDCLSRAHLAGIPTFTVMWEPADLFHEARWAIRRFLAR